MVPGGADSSILLRPRRSKTRTLIAVSYFQLRTSHFVASHVEQSQYRTKIPKAACSSPRGSPSPPDKAEISRHHYPICDKKSP